jgi:alkanesulfonate monooxygenase SsuD/methylene tetrahydromethanopterin reductase-like flavin-dependent oxidoreductase (luciferase family)
MSARSPDHTARASGANIFERHEVMMRFGLVLNWHRPVDAMPRSNVADIDELVEQIQVAERLGFTSAWPLEHDVARGDVPATWPHELMSRIATATRTIRVGHRLWPSDDCQDGPLHIAERAAALDLLCEGRLEIDCSPWATVDRVASIGPAWESQLQPEETERRLRMVVAAWSDGGLGQRDSFFDLPEQAAIAKPLQRPHPPLWMSANDTSDWILAGKLGMGVLASAPPNTALQSRIDAHRHALAGSAGGANANRQVAVSALAICSATEGRATAMHQLGRWPRGHDRPSSGRVETPARRLRRSTRQLVVGDGSRSGQALAGMGLLIGSSERCIEVATAYAKIGVDRLLCHFPFRGNHAETTEAIMRFGDDVIAAFA